MAKLAVDNIFLHSGDWEYVGNHIGRRPGTSNGSIHINIRNKSFSRYFNPNSLPRLKALASATVANFRDHMWPQQTRPDSLGYALF
ncbi:hypothetical protein JCM33374_g5878 [Metschnikowia sp. JCM 33374]|nr:hypothetical protein JCM33374_g5878 [Metschnikowia sp. JCM 33374]